ncbi:MAG TPA: class I SAM-dependent methyltransferase [Candidatus Dormibacteraeota bacterium]|jgi:SAM-dependent methyltransferase|nr:class I SAM-dependent methyltransferase [Candidatus Dormibacteraeota bacterium]
MSEYLEVNKRRWNELARLHPGTAFYDLDRLRGGGSSLHRLEVDEVGPVEGRRLLHLQCHIGTETVSWARLGALVTGVDFAEAAVDEARRLAAACAVDATFVLSAIDDLPNNLDGTFDIVFTSWGVIGWLPDLGHWAEVVAHFLEPGGVFYIAEGHPVAWTFDDESPDLAVRYDYFPGHFPQEFESQGSYADREEAVVNRRTYEWTWTLGQVVSALADAGLVIEFVHEHDRITFQMLPILELDEDDPDEPGRWYRMPPGRPRIPLSFSIRARRP